MGHTIHDHILRKRIEQAKKLLTKSETNTKTAAIAQEAGFGSRERFSKAFKLATGMSPAEYRDKESGA
jgi:transcriptional regulator GlxA family with amidase domain